MDFFKYLEESTPKERAAIATELKALYNAILEDERQTFSRAYKARANSKASRDYFESVQRVGTIQAVFEILHIDYEPGETFPDIITPF